jgi:hypothetical protein
MAKRKELTSKEQAAAKLLRDVRPVCYPGTNVCISREQQVEWFDEVRQAMGNFRLPRHLISKFCDVAGVPS